MPRERSRLRLLRPPRRVPEHPYRDSALVYGFFAVAVVVIAALTGGSIYKAILVACAVFVVAVSWSWVRWRRELQEESRRKALEERMRSS